MILRAKGDRIALGLLLLLVLVVFIPAIPVEGMRSADFYYHNMYAMELLKTGVPVASHFLYELLVIAAVKTIPRLDFVGAAMLVMILSYSFIASLLYCLLRSQKYCGPAAAAVASLALMIVAPINLLTLDGYDLYFGYIGISVYHNPTNILLKPLALILFLSSMKAFDDSRSGMPRILWISFLLIISTFVKPSYTICLVPALVVVAVFGFLRNRGVDWKLIIAAGAVSILALGWQYWFTYSKGPRVPMRVSSGELVRKLGEGKTDTRLGKTSTAGLGKGTRTGGSADAGSDTRQNEFPIEFAPFLVAGHYSSHLMEKLLLSILFPVCVTLLYFREVRKSFELQFAWLVFFLAAFYNYFLAETGPDMYAWNFTWGAQISLFVLFVVSILFLIRNRKGSRVRMTLCLVVVGLHVVSGIIFYGFFVFSTARVKKTAIESPARVIRCESYPPIAGYIPPLFVT